MSYSGDLDAGESGSRKRARPDDLHAPGPSGSNDDALASHDGFQLENGEDDDDDEEGPKDKKAGRRKIKIEFIQDKSRRHITFSKRKAGIMKKAYELSTLTGTQVLLLVVSETGLVYTFTTAKLQPLVTQPEGKNLIQACLNAPPGQLPSSYPVGQPIGRSAPAGARHSNSSAAPQSGASNGASNLPGTLSIGARDEESEHGSISPPLGGDAARGSARPQRRAAANRQSYREASESPPQPTQDLSPPLPHTLPPPPPPQQQQQPSYHSNGPAGYAPPGPSPLMQSGNGAYSQYAPYPALAGPGGSAPPDWNPYHRR